MTVVLAVGGIASAHSVALSRGVQLVHVRTHRHHTMLPPSHYFKVIDASHLANRELSQLKYVLKQVEGIAFDAILCLHDDSVVLGARLAEKIGLAFASVSTAKATVDKVLMRHILSNTNLGSVRYGVVVGGDVSWITDPPGGSVVLKPSTGRASVGVQVLPDIDSVQRVIGKDPFEFEGYLVEERKIGAEYSVESLLSSVGEWHGVTAKTTAGVIETGHVHPAPITEGEAWTIRSAAASALEYLGIKRGLLHTEVILDRQGVPHIVETHLRGGGDGILDLVKYATGLDLTDLYVDDLLNRLHDLPNAQIGRAASCQYSLPHSSGVLTGWSGIDEAKQCKGVVDIGTILSIGDWVQVEQQSSYTRLAWAIATANDGRLAQYRARKAVNTIVPHATKEKE